MARFNEILTGRFNRALQKTLSMKGPASTAQLGSELMPVLQFPLGGEFRYLEQWNLFGIGVDLAPVAANNGAFQIRNPVGSNIIAVVHSLVFSNDTPALNIVDIEGPTPLTTDLGTINTGVRLDGRLGGLNYAQSTILSSQNTAPLGAIPGSTVSGLYVLGINGNPINVLEQIEIPLLPGDVFRMRNRVVNAELTLTMFWRERFLEESERF